MTHTPMTVPMYGKEDSTDISRKDINRIALIDADRFKYVVAHNMFYEMNTEGEKHSKELLERLIDNCLERYVFNHYNATAYVFCFSAPSKQVYRNLLACEKGYKAQRAKKDDPYYYEEKYDDMAYVYKYISLNQISLLKNNLEADDIMSLLQCQYTFIHSIDKDMKQVGGMYYEENDYEFIEISQDDGFKLLMEQTIKGDSVDNIPGLKGFGDKFVETLHKFEGEQLLQVVIGTFIKKHGVVNGTDMFVEMYNLVTLKRRRGLYTEELHKDMFDLINNLSKLLKDE